MAGGAIALLGLAAAVFLCGCASSSPEGNSGLADSPYPNVDASNTRHAEGSIRRTTVSSLEVAWTLPITAKGYYGGYASSPVVASGVAYSQDLDSNVQAIDVESGEVLWEKSYESSISGPSGIVVANGVVVADGRVYGATATSAFALDRQTGDEIWSTEVVRSESEQIDMAPGHHDDLVYVSTVPVAEEGGEVGTLWALDARTGEKTWSFDTVPRGLWGNPDLNFGGGLSYPPAFDGQGSMYFGVGSPGPIPGTERYPWGSSRPGPNLYTNSIVKLSAKTGELQWHYQVAPHSLCNGDIGPPVLTRAGGRDLVIAAGTSGIVVALDRQTGKVVWRRAIGRHNGHDDDGLHAMRGEYAKLKTPMTVYPGVLGGAFAPLSVSKSTIFVPVVNYGALLVSQSEAKAAGSMSGELVAIDARTGGVEWKRSFSSGLLGAPTTVNDLVLAATFDGTMYAFAGTDGEEVWRAALPAGFNAGLTVSGDTLLAPAGVPTGKRQTPKLTAYRLPS